MQVERIKTRTHIDDGEIEEGVLRSRQPKYFIVLECVTGWKLAKDIHTPL